MYRCIDCTKEGNTFGVNLHMFRIFRHRQCLPHLKILIKCSYGKFFQKINTCLVCSGLKQSVFGAFDPASVNLPFVKYEYS